MKQGYHGRNLAYLVKISLLYKEFTLNPTLIRQDSADWNDICVINIYKDWFPVFKFGTALRSEKKTAVYYTKETQPLDRAEKRIK